VSRGRGRWQRAILKVLATTNNPNAFVPLTLWAASHLGRWPDRPELVAIRRAAHTLAAAGLCELTTGVCCDACGSWKLLPAESLSMRLMADVFGVSPSTISRELASQRCCGATSTRYLVVVNVAPVPNGTEATHIHTDETLPPLHTAQGQRLAKEETP
jgi:hypothetical protein